MYEKLSKRALFNMYLGTITGTAFLLAIVIVLETVFLIPEKITIGVIIGYVAIVVMICHALLSPVFRFFRYRYKIDEECIDITEGYIFVTRTIVPIERLHKMEVVRGPYDKICGVAKVNVTTAGGDVTIRFLETHKADAIAETLKRKINEIAIEEKQKMKER